MKNGSHGFVGCLLALLVLAGCGDDKKPAPASAQDAPARTFTDAEYVAAFHRGVNELEQHRFLEAAQTFDELARSRPTLVAPWINLASAQLNRNVEASHALCLAATEKATALDPRAPQPYFLRGILFKHLGKFEEAEKQFRETLKHAPDDPATLYNLSSVIAEKDPAEATALLEKAIEGETHFSGAYYALMGMKRRSGAGGAEGLARIFQAFEAANTGNKMKIVYTEMGRLGEAIRDLPVVAESRPASRERPQIEFENPITVPGMPRAVIDVGGKPALICRREDESLVGYQWNGKELAPQDVLAGAKAGAQFSTLTPGDFNGDGHDDLVLADGAGVRLLASDGRSFKQAGADLLGAGYQRCAGSDLDQDGDLDLIAWNETEVAILVNRRDGTFERYDPKPSPTPAKFEPLPLPKAPGGISQVCPTDLDGDGDPDLLIAGNGGLKLWRNDRLMRFTDATARAGFSPSDGALAVLVEDLDGDRMLDVVSFNPATVFRQTKGSFRLTFSRTQVKDLMTETWPRVGDFDSDGSDEVVLGASRGEISIHSLAGLPGGGGSPVKLRLENGTAGAPVVADFDGDLVLDLVVANGPNETRVYRGKKPPQNHALEIKLRGKIFANTMHSNMGGIGARVEVMAGNRFQVREMRSNEGNTLHFGLGSRTAADYVRIVWPDDVLQSEGWVPADQIKVVEEFQRKASSCPILFAWNGERFECVTDFLGTGGLGFFLEPGVYGTPDPTEQVLIPRLEPKDGKLEIRIHEPFEEITYLDAAKLLVIDHPETVDVLPDERFAINAPQPDGKLLAIEKRFFAAKARDGRGRDVTRDVLLSDRKQARAVADPRFLGYAEPTTFEFVFTGPPGGSEQVYLELDGWVEYPYSHINLAAWQAGVRLEAMSVEVEVEGKGFVRIQNEACYPAGMPRIMTLPLGKLPEGFTGKLRLVTNQELWIDRIALFQPADVKLEVRTLEATSAVLRASGYPREYSPDGGAPRLYDYDILDPSFPWKTMGGTYTAFGEVGEILRDADDCYAIFGGGEEIAMTFDPPPPPAPGMKRTYVLDTFGWCKDMDAYTAFPDTVEPLPFKAMSNYPYRPDESFPDGEAQKRWRERYQTRVVPGTRAR
jgi:tetratricopeptide (TPR) repeat protein